MSNNPGTLRLVMIDDDPGDIEIVRRYLESYTDAPVEFLPFLTTKSFEDRFQDLKPDLILLDYLLAGDDGLSLLKRIKSAGAGPVIVLTGHGDERIAVEIMRAGAEDYIIKSDLSPDLLRRAIRETINRARLVAEKKRMEEELQKSFKKLLKAKKAAERANKAKSDFLSVVSHELRTPLTSILGFAELLFQRESRTLHAQSVSDINTILRNGKNLLHLIEEILNFKRIEAGRMEILPVPVRLNELVLEVVETVKPLVSAKPIRIETSLPPFFPAVCTDATRLRQVLINVVENSIKFTETGRIRITLLPIRPGASLVTFKISDTGIGIPRKKLKVIFRKFEQGHTGLTRKYGGAGLGLTISRSIMQLLGGDISVRSSAGKGSEFTLTLPFHPAPG